MKKFATIGLSVAAVALLTACHGHHDKSHYFDKIDANGDGKISHKEMHDYGHNKLHKMDANGDRYVSREEFHDYKCKKHCHSKVMDEGYYHNNTDRNF